MCVAHLGKSIQYWLSAVSNNERNLEIIYTVCINFSWLQNSAHKSPATNISFTNTKISYLTVGNSLHLNEVFGQFLYFEKFETQLWK